MSCLAKRLLHAYTHHPSVPTGPPRNPRAKGASTSSIAVAWDTVDPFKRNGEIIMYEVLYLPDEMTEIDTETVNQTADEGFVQQTEEELIFLWNLTEFTGYAVFVRAANINGMGPYAKKVVAVTLQDEVLEGSGSAGINHSVISTLNHACKHDKFMTWTLLAFYMKGVQKQGN